MYSYTQERRLQIAQTLWNNKRLAFLQQSEYPCTDTCMYIFSICVYTETKALNSSICISSMYVCMYVYMTCTISSSPDKCMHGRICVPVAQHGVLHLSNQCTCVYNIYIHSYTHTHVYTHAYAYAYRSPSSVLHLFNQYTCAYIRIHTHVYTHAYAYVCRSPSSVLHLFNQYTCMYIYTHMYKMHTHMCAGRRAACCIYSGCPEPTHRRVSMLIYIYIYIHTHTRVLHLFRLSWAQALTSKYTSHIPRMNACICIHTYVGQSDYISVHLCDKF